MTEIGIEYFIPARALEHPANSETAILNQKIRWAVLRYHQKQDFDSFLEVQDPVPYVILKSIIFDKDQLGYKVTGTIKSG